MSNERKLGRGKPAASRGKPPAAPKGDFWDAVRVKSADAFLRPLTDDADRLSKEEARVEALSAFLYGTTERAYIESRATGEKIDCTAEMRKVEEEWHRRSRGPVEIDKDGSQRWHERVAPHPGEIEEIIRTVLPAVDDGDADEPPDAS